MSSILTYFYNDNVNEKYLYSLKNIVTSLCIFVQSLVENIKILNATSCETMLDILVQMFIACVQSENARESLLKHKVVSAWIPVLKRCAGTENNACEQAFCYICHLMLDIEKPELVSKEFVQEYIDCGGPDITVDMLQTFMESKRGSMVIGAFCMLLPLCRVSWGQKWLRKSYHKIVECYQFFDSTTELLDFPNTSIQKVRTIWHQFKDTFDIIQAVESKKHEAELLAEEEKEKARREKKNERKKKKEQKKVHNEKSKASISSPNASVEESDESKTEVVNKTPDNDQDWRNLEARKAQFEKVLSKKELKLNKKKAQICEHKKAEVTETEHIVKKSEKLKTDEDEDTSLNFRPNKGKPSGFKIKSISKIKPSDLPWRNLKQPGDNSTSPGKEFPKLTSPGKEFPKLRSPGKEFSKLTSPGKEFPKLRSPGKEFSKLTSPGKEFPKLTSPGKEFSKLTSSGKEFPKLCKEKFANMMKELHEENEKATLRTKQFTLSRKANEMFKSAAEKSTMKLSSRACKDNNEDVIRNLRKLEKNTVNEEKNFNEIFGSVFHGTKKTDVFEIPEENSARNEAGVCKTSNNEIFIANGNKHKADNGRKNSTHHEESSESRLSKTKCNDMADTAVTDDTNLNLLDMVANEVRSYYTHSNSRLALQTLEHLGKEDNTAVANDGTQGKDRKDDVILSGPKDQEKIEELPALSDATAMDSPKDTGIKTSLKSIWDISPVGQDINEVRVAPFMIPTEKFSSASKANKKRSRATFTVQRELFKMPNDVSPLEVVARMNEENNIRSNLQRSMNVNNDNDANKKPQESDNETKVQQRKETANGSPVDPAVNIIGNKECEFMSDAKLKSTGNIKSDVNGPQYKTTNQDSTIIDLANIQFGYFSSSTSTSCESGETARSSDFVNDRSNNEETKVGLLAKSTSPSQELHQGKPIEPNSKSASKSDSELVSISDNVLFKPFGDPISNSDNLARCRVNKDQTCTNRFGAIGERVPVQTSQNFRDFSSLRQDYNAWLTDHSRLKPGDGDRLLDEDEEREMFGSRSYWTEPSYFGFGWLDGLSQLVSAQKELAHTGNLEKVFQNYPVFEKGIEYECFKKRRREEQWQKKQIVANLDKFSYGEPVQVDQEKAFTLIPQHLLDSPMESEGTNFVQNHSNQFYPPGKLNTHGWPEQDQQQRPRQRVDKECELFPVQQMPSFQTGDMCFPQPGIPVIGSQHAFNVMQVQHLLQTKVPPFNTDSSQTQTGQGDPYFYHDVYVNAARQLIGGPAYPGEQVKQEITKTRSVPFLSSASALAEAEKLDPSFTRMTPEYLSEASDRSGLTSTTISTINSFKSANELVCSRSDVSVSCDRLGESFVIGKGYVS